LNHGALCNQSGLFDAAIEDFSAVIDLDPWDIPAYFNRFLSHFAKLDYKSALKDLYIAVSLGYTREG
jgi:lipoprotein NlpI